MTIKIHNVRTLLELVSSLEIENKSNSKNVETNFELRGIEQGVDFTFYKETLDFCKLTSLIKLENEYVILTKLGKDFLKDRLSFNEQRSFLISNCILEGEFSKIILPIVDNFNSNTTSVWCEMSEVEIRFKKYNQFLGLLYELNFLVKNYNDDTVEISSEFVNTDNFQKQIKDAIRISLSKQEENRKKDEEENKITGRIAEEIVVNFERSRLNEMECFEEAKKVEQISDDYSNAGYDVESFKGIAKNLEIYDKHIEVKGTTTDDFRFFWSKNEIKKAKKFGDRYWIYFVVKINKKDNSGEISEMIQDPFRKIDPLNYFGNNDYNKECESYKITKK